MLRQRVIYKNNGHPNPGEQMTILTENIDGLAPFYKSYLPQMFKSMMVPAHHNHYNVFSSISIPH